MVHSIVPQNSLPGNETDIDLYFVKCDELSVVPPKKNWKTSQLGVKPVPTVTPVTFPTHPTINASTLPKQTTAIPEPNKAALIPPSQTTTRASQATENILDTSSKADLIEDDGSVVESDGEIGEEDTSHNEEDATAKYMKTIMDMKQRVKRRIIKPAYQQSPSSVYEQNNNNVKSQVEGYECWREFTDKLTEGNVDKYVDLPMIAVMGDTSSGKSSLLSNISLVELPSSDTLTQTWKARKIDTHEVW